MTIAVVVGLLLAPQMTARAVVVAERCMVAAKAGHEPDPLGCVQAAHRWLLVPSVLPWTDAEVEADRRQRLQHAARFVLETSSAMFPDARRLGEAARVLSAAPNQADLTRMWDAGAVGVALESECPMNQMGGNAKQDAACFRHQWHKLMPAMQRGLRDRLLATGNVLQQAYQKKHPISKPNHLWGCPLQLGAGLCLFGAADQGRRILETQNCGSRLKAAPGFDAARKLSLVACGKKDLRLRQRADGSEADWLELPVRNGVVAARIKVDGAWRKRRNPARMFFSAAALVQDTPELKTALEYLLDQGGTRRLTSLHRAFANPFAAPDVLNWAQFAGSETFYAVPIAMFEQAARHLDRLAAAAPTSAGSDSEPPAEVSDPKALLKRVAWIMRIYAATESLRRARLGRARAILRQTPPIEGGWGQVRARLLLKTGAIEESLKAVDALTASLPEGKQKNTAAAMLGTIRALALIALGKDQQAYEAITSAEQSARVAPRYWSQEGLGLTADSARTRIAWLRLALAWRLGHRAPDFRFIEPSVKSVDGKRKGTSVRGWWQALTASPQQRRKERPKLRLLELRTEYVSLGRGCDDITPYQMYLVGEAVDDDGEVEVWLDRIFARVMRSGRCALRARATAARWRDDEVNASTWQRRAKAMDKLINNDAAALLSAAAGL